MGTGPVQGMRPPMQGGPIQGGPPQMGGRPTQVPPQQSQDAQYINAFTTLLNTPTYKAQDEEEKKSTIGDFIYNYIVKLSSEDDAPKITGMIIDLPEQDLIDSVKTLAGLREKVNEGKTLLEADGDD